MSARRRRGWRLGEAPAGPPADAPAVVLALALLWAACGSPPPAIPELGELAGVEPEVRRGLETARAALVEEPGSPAAWARLGMVADAHGFDRVAVPCYRRARELDPGEPRWAYLLARLLAIEGSDGEEVVALLGEVVELAPRHAPAWVRLAEARLELGRAAAAEEAFGRALELDQRLVAARLGLGRIALGENRIEQAIGHLEAARELAPGSAPVLANLGRAYRLAGRPEAARTVAGLAATARPAPLPDDPWLAELGRLAVSSSLRFERALARIRDGDPAGALPELEAVVRARPRDPAVQAELGGVYQALGRAEEAARAFAAAVELKQDWPEARLQLAALLLELDRTAEAEGHLERLEPLAPELPLVDGYLGLALTRQGRLEEAVARFRRAAASGALPPELEGGWGSALAQLGRVAEAETHFRRALADSPGSAQLHLYLGLALEAQGRAGEAAASYRRSLELEPSPLAGQRLEALGGAPPGRR